MIHSSPVREPVSLATILTAAAVLFLGQFQARAQNLHLGDLDNDGVIEVTDLALLYEHIKGTALLDEHRSVLADVTKDGAVNQADADEMVKEILQSRTPEQLPLSTVRFTSPASGEGDVAVTRETIVHFTVPLSLGATLDTTKFYAEFAGRKVLSRVEIASDRRKASLFYLEPLAANSRVKVTLDGSGLADLIGRPFDADGDSLPGGVWRSSFDAVVISPIGTTGMTGRVMGSTNNQGQPVPPFPIPGVTITVDGAEQTLRAVTAADGTFTLSPCPTGAFFVHIDGRTSPLSHWPAGEYFPSVGKSWEAIPGKADNPAGGTGLIYLPCVCAGTLQTVSPTQTTSLTFAPQVLAARPELADARITVPANSLFADDGTRGGKVGIYPVPPDKLPSTLPPGLNLPLVITIQTDGGTNFDRPVPVCLPNLPDPVTGKLLAPGEKSALWSFNHDTGGWEVVGAMTVAPDGKCVTTDAGVGVRQPGWHGSQPGAQADSPPPRTDCDTEAEGLAKANRDLAKAMDELQSLIDDWNLHKYLTDKAFNKAREETFKMLDQRKLNGDLLFDGRSSLRIGNLYLKGFVRGVGKFLGFTGLIANGINCTQALANSDTWVAISGTACGATLLDLVQLPFKGLKKTAEAAAAAAHIWAQQARVQQYERDAQRAFELYQKCLGIGGGNQANQRTRRNAAAPSSEKALSALLEGNRRLEEESRLQQPTWQRIAVDADSCDQIAEKLLLYESNHAEPPPTIIELRTLLAASSSIDALNDQLAEHPSLEAAIDLNRALLADYFECLDVSESPASTAELEARMPRVNDDSLYCELSSGGSVFGRFKADASGRFSRILAPNTFFRLRVYSPKSGFSGSVVFYSADNGERSILPTPVLGADFAPDLDGDGLKETAESIIGTDPTKADTDNDGVSDSAELANGTDPLSGLAASTGIVGKAELTGTCVDVTAFNDVLAAACGAEGVYVLGVRQGLSPTRLGQVGTAPASASVVALSSSMLAIGLGADGVRIADLTTPDAPQVLRTIKLGSTVKSLAAVENTVYIGLSDGRIVAADMLTGRLLASTNVGQEPHDLAVGARVLYAATVGELKVVPLTDTGFGSVSSLSMPGSVGAGQRRLRLFRGTDRLYAVHTQGFNAVNITNPLAPVFIRNNTDNQFGWKHLVANGSGLALAAVDPNSTNDGAHDVSLYDLGSDNAQANFLTRFETPGLAQSIAIYNGLAYVADGSSGVQVVNYRPFDTLKVPPTIALSVQATNARVAEGSFFPVSALVTDDVQVRNVEFYVDGEKAETDGNFPFEGRLLAPRLTDTKTTVLVKARATDTGGNATWSAETTLTLTLETTPPSVVSFAPADGSFLATASGFSVKFSEPVKASTLNSATIRFYAAGPDLQVGTDDDLPVAASLLPAASGSGLYRDTAAFQSAGPLPTGNYRVLISLGVQDTAGNPLTAPHTSTFYVVGPVGTGADSDGDGIPDTVEAALGYDPNSMDADGNGIMDGDEDKDSDGLTNVFELRYNLNPNNADTNANGIPDAQEDTDGDTLTLLQEFFAGSDPTKVDTDGDGWPDQVEVEFHSRPNDARSKPLSLFVSQPPTTVAIIGGGTNVSAPPVNIAIIGGGTTISTPPTNIAIIGGGTNVGTPPVKVKIGTP